jgi:hypothetical protein
LIGENKRQPNKSMDMSAKQRLFYSRSVLNSTLRGGGFAPRHLNRWAFSGGEQTLES